MGWDSATDETRFYINLIRNNMYGAKKYDLFSIPGPPGYGMLGHIPNLCRPDYHSACLDWANQYGGVCRISLGWQHIIIVSDPELAAAILGRGKGSVPRKSIGYLFFDMATNHLGLRSFFTTSNEEQWQVIRKGTAQAFSHANIKRYYVCTLKHAQELVERVRQAATYHNMQVEIQEHLEMMLLDIFLEGLFEVDLRRVNSEEVAHAMNFVLEEANERVKFPLRSLVQSIMHPLFARKVRKAQKTLGDLYGRIYDMMRSRGIPPEEETVLWACLARLKCPKTGQKLTREQLLPEIGAFIMAGFDTSSHTIAWCLYTIASNPAVQKRINLELQEYGLLHSPKMLNCVTPRQLTYEDLARLDYLNCVIDETMRMYPVAATASVRETTSPTRIGKYTVPEGIVVWPMVYAMHNSRHLWEDPEVFRPERWTVKGAGHTADGFKKFLPFSDGMKSCLGQALGMMEVRTVLASLLCRFWFELAPSMGGAEKVHKQMTIALTLKIRGGLKLVCKPHEK